MVVPGHGKLCFVMDNQGTSLALWEPENQCTSVLVKKNGVWLRAAHRNIVPNPYGQLRGNGL